jgi:hypothetical protein
MRDAKAASTTKHTVITLSRAMMRSGWFSYREEAKHCGSFTHRHPRSPCTGPVSPANISGGGRWVGSRSVVARMTPPGWSLRACRAVRVEANAPSRWSTPWVGRAAGPGRPRVLERGCARPVLAARSRVGQSRSPVERACRASASPATVVRHHVFKALGSWSRCWRHGRSTVRRAGAWRSSASMRTQRGSMPPSRAGHASSREPAGSAARRWGLA